MVSKWLRFSRDYIGNFARAHRPFSRRKVQSSIEYFDQKFIKSGVRAKLTDGWLIVAYKPAAKYCGKHWAYKIYKDNRLEAFGLTPLRLKTVDNRGLIQRSHIKEVEATLLDTLRQYRLESTSPVLYGTVVLR